MLNEPDEFGVIKAVTTKIDLGIIVLDAYMLPSGEKRLGIENTGLAIGGSKNLFFSLTKRSKTLQSLKSMGFSNEERWVSVIGHRENKIGERYRTISIRDFIKLVTFEALHNRNKNAISLLAAFAEFGLEKVIEEAFAGRSIEFILEKIVHYSKWTYEEFEEVLAYNREEVKALHPWGTPPSLDDGNHEL